MFIPSGVAAAAGHQYVYFAGTSGSKVGFSKDGGGTGTLTAGDFPQRDFTLHEIFIQVTTDLWILRLVDVGGTTSPADSDAVWRECRISGVFDSGQATVSWTRSGATYTPQAVGFARWTKTDVGVPLMVDGNQYTMQLLT